MTHQVTKTKPRASEFTQEEFEAAAAEVGAHCEDVDFEHSVSDDGLSHSIGGSVNTARHEKRLADKAAAEKAKAEAEEKARAA